MITVHKAERRKAKLRLAISGSSGSGKTYSALLIARGLVGNSGRILLVDTERGSGELYANLTDYDVASLEPPYTTENYIEAINYAEDNGYDCIILDSISHAWAGEGGLLEQVDQIASRSGNKFSSWSSITPKHQRFIDAMLRCKIHLIATMRSKTEYVLVQDANGKNKPEKRALAPVQRDGIDYEFTVVFDLAPNHTAEASKDRTGKFNGLIFTPDNAVGELLRDWLETGTDAIETPKPVVSAPVIQTVSADVKPEPKNKYSAAEVNTIRQRYQDNGWSEKIFDEARYDAATWDKDMIMADFRKRSAASTPAPAPKVETPKPETPKQVAPTTAQKEIETVSQPETPAAQPEPQVVVKCSKCGADSMTVDDLQKLMACTAGIGYTGEIPVMCTDCAKKWWKEILAGQETETTVEPQPEVKQEVKTEEKKVETKTEKKPAKKTEAKTETTDGKYICYQCGASMPKVQWEVSNMMAGRGLCADCFNHVRK